MSFTKKQEEALLSLSKLPIIPVSHKSTLKKEQATTPTVKKDEKKKAKAETIPSSTEDEKQSPKKPTKRAREGNNQEERKDTKASSKKSKVKEDDQEPLPKEKKKRTTTTKKTKPQEEKEVEVDDEQIVEVIVPRKSKKTTKTTVLSKLPNVLFQYDFSPESTHMMCMLFDSIKQVLGDSFQIQFVAAEPVINIRVSSVSSSKQDGVMNITSLCLAKEDVFEMDSLILPPKNKMLHVTTAYFLSCMNDRSKKRSMTWVYRQMDQLAQEEEAKEGQVQKEEENKQDQPVMSNPYPFTFYFNRDKPGNTREFSLQLNMTHDFVDDIYTLDPGDMYIAQVRVSTKAFHAILKDLHVSSASENKKTTDNEEKWCQLVITPEYLRVATYHVPGSGGAPCHKQITCHHNDPDIHGEDDEYSTCAEIINCKPKIFSLIFDIKSLIMFILERLPNVTHFDMTILDRGLLNKYKIGNHSHLAFLIPSKEVPNI